MNELGRLFGEISGRRRGADVVVAEVVERTGSPIFGLPAESINAIVDAVRRNPKANMIAVRHEGNASLMASAYGKLTGQLGVCMATNGPGATHLAPGCLDAREDGAPFLAITGTVGAEHIGAEAFQDVDAGHLLGSVSARAHSIWAPASMATLSRTVRRASDESTAIAVTVSPDALLAPAVRRALPKHGTVPPAPDHWRSDRAALDSALEIIGAARSGAVVIGDTRGIDRDDLANWLDCRWPVLGTPESIQGPGWDEIAREHRLSRADGPAAELLAGVDTLVVVGRWPGGTEAALAGAEAVIHVTDRPLPRPDGRNYIQVRSADTALLVERQRPRPAPKARSTGPRRSGIGVLLEAVLPDDAVVALEPGAITEAVYDMCTARGRVFTSSFAATTTGYAIPAAIAASVAYVGRPVVALTDWNGLSESYQELLTARKYGLPVRVLLVDDPTAWTEEGVAPVDLAASLGYTAREFAGSDPEPISTFLAAGPWQLAVVSSSTSSDVESPAEVDDGADRMRRALTDLGVTVFQSRAPKVDGLGLTAAQTEAASMSASGSAKAGVPSALLATSEVDLLRMLNGLHDAAFDNAPLLVVTVENRWRCDAGEVLRDIVSATYTVDASDDCASVAADALRSSQQSSSIVHLRVRRSLSRPVARARRTGASAIGRPIPDDATMVRLRRAFEDARRPLFLVGAGAVSAIDAITALSRSRRIPIVATMGSQGAFEHLHGFAGYAGSSGHFTALRAEQDADLIVVLGVSNRGAAFELGGHDTAVVDINTDAGVFPRGGHRDYLPVIGDIAETLSALRLEPLETTVDTGWMTGVSGRYLQWMKREGHAHSLRNQLRPSHVIRRLDRTLRGSDFDLFADVGLNTLWLYRHFSRHKGTTWTRNFATMGFAVPAAIGVLRSRKVRRALAVVGDGGFAMTMWEIQTAVRDRLPLGVVIMNNAGLGAIRYEEEIMGWPEHESGLWNGEFAAFARACGAEGIQVDTVEQLEKALERLQGLDGPVVIDVRCSTDEPPVPAKVPGTLKRVSMLVGWLRQGRKGLRSAAATLPGMWNR